MTPPTDIMTDQNLTAYDAEERRAKRFTVREYFQMAEAGILPEKPRTELIRGEIQLMMPIGRPHGMCIMSFSALLFEHLGLKNWCVISQSTVELDNESAPEPDITILKGGQERFVDQEPENDDYSHVIEVAESSLRRDRGIKQSLYAEHGIRNYWIVNLIDRTIEHYTQPHFSQSKSDYEYSQRVVYREHDSVTMTFEGEQELTFTPADILPIRPKQ